MDAIATKYPRFGVLNVDLAIGNIKLPIKKSGCKLALYNRWNCGHYIFSVFMFAPDRCIRAMVIDALGSMHESTVMDISEMYCSKHADLQAKLAE